MEGAAEDERKVELQSKAQGYPIAELEPFPRPGVLFTKSRMFENYLLHAKAVAALNQNDVGREPSKHVVVLACQIKSWPLQVIPPAPYIQMSSLIVYLGKYLVE